MKTNVLVDGHNLLLDLAPEGQEELTDFDSWRIRKKAFIDDSLRNYGAILFRGYAIDDVGKFEQAARAISSQLASYVDGNSPRTKISSNIYTSTEYPCEFFISLHNELSYAAQWPERLYFCCVVAPEHGGETPLADSRQILRALDSEVVAEFKRRRIKYVRNLHGGKGFGQSWQQTFETTDPRIVEQYLRESESTWQWRPDTGLSIYSNRPATAYHPRTGEEIWFNQADQFHPSTHPKEVYEAMMALYGGREDHFPQNALFGDGAPIPVSMLDHIRAKTNEQTIDFRWQTGDFLVIDNMLICHGRRPFTGKRRILVAMSGSVIWKEDCLPQTQIANRYGNRLNQNI